MISNKVVAVPVFGIPVPAWTYEIEETETIFYTKEKGERTHSQCFKYMVRKRKKVVCGTTQETKPYQSSLGLLSANCSKSSTLSFRRAFSFSRSPRSRIKSSRYLFCVLGDPSMHLSKISRCFLDDITESDGSFSGVLARGVFGCPGVLHGVIG